MSEAVRETLCTNCAHSQVCSHKTDYLAMVMALENTYNHFIPSQRDFMALNDPGCKFFDKKWPKLKSLGNTDLSNYFPVQRIIQGEDEPKFEKGLGKE